jgi:hypothetical protein
VGEDLWAALRDKFLILLVTDGRAITGAEREQVCTVGSSPTHICARAELINAIVLFLERKIHAWRCC